jgi:hypothetical protein
MRYQSNLLFSQRELIFILYGEAWLGVQGDDSAHEFHRLQSRREIGSCCRTGSLDK